MHLHDRVHRAKGVATFRRLVRPGREDEDAVNAGSESQPANPPVHSLHRLARRFPRVGVVAIVRVHVHDIDHVGGRHVDGEIAACAVEGPDVDDDALALRDERRHHRRIR